jgi:hypothetical protein
MQKHQNTSLIGANEACENTKKSLGFRVYGLKKKEKLHYSPGTTNGMTTDAETSKHKHYRGRTKHVKTQQGI